MLHMSLADVRELPELRHILSDARRRPAKYRGAQNSVRALRANGTVVDVRFGPRGGRTLKVVGRVK